MQFEEDELRELHRDAKIQKSSHLPFKPSRKPSLSTQHFSCLQNDELRFLGIGEVSALKNQPGMVYRKEWDNLVIGELRLFSWEEITHKTQDLEGTESRSQMKLSMGSHLATPPAIMCALSNSNLYTEPRAGAKPPPVVAYQTEMNFERITVLLCILPRLIPTPIIVIPIVVSFQFSRIMTMCLSTHIFGIKNRFLFQVREINCMGRTPEQQGNYFHPNIPSN